MFSQLGYQQEVLISLPTAPDISYRRLKIKLTYRQTYRHWSYCFTNLQLLVGIPVAQQIYAHARLCAEHISSSLTSCICLAYMQDEKILTLYLSQKRLLAPLIYVQQLSSDNQQTIENMYRIKFINIHIRKNNKKKEQ